MSLDVDDLHRRLAGQPQRVAGQPAVEDRLADDQGGQLGDALDDVEGVHATPCSGGPAGSGTGQGVLPVRGEPVDAEALRPPACALPRTAPRPPTGREQPLRVLDEPGGIGLHVAADAVLDRCRHLGRREPEDGQPERHRLADREAERGVADRVEEEAVAAEAAVQIGEPDVADALRELVAVHPGEVERDLLGDGAEHVRTQPSTAPAEVVDDRDAALQLAGPGQPLGDDDAVVDDRASACRPLSHIRALKGVTCTSSVAGVLHGVLGLVRPRLRRVVLEVDARDVPQLLGREDLVPVGLPVAAATA